MSANHERINMKNNQIASMAVAAAAAGLAGSAQAVPVSALVEQLKSKDDNVRGDAWQKAGPAGAPAVAPVAALWTDADFEVARSAKRAVWNIVRHAGRPGAGPESKAVEQALLPLTGHAAASVRREAIWMLSEIGGGDTVSALAKLLGDVEVRDDARCGLERIPGGDSIVALRQAMKTVPEEFRYALAESLRKRGEKVEGYPSRKLVPTK